MKSRSIHVDFKKYLNGEWVLLCAGSKCFEDSYPEAV